MTEQHIRDFLLEREIKTRKGHLDEEDMYSKKLEITIVPTWDDLEYSLSSRTIMFKRNTAMNFIWGSPIAWIKSSLDLTNIFGLKKTNRENIYEAY